jgi:hypothetical protein
MIEGQGMVGDTMFHNSDRDVARVEIQHAKDRDGKAWQDKDEVREARNWR